MNKSTDIKELATALAAFQAKIPDISKGSDNPFFKSQYASLSDILSAIRTPLTECNLVISQHPNGDALTTIIIHTTTGQFLESSLPLHPVPEFQKEKDKDGGVTWRSEPYTSPQSLGACITYARRQAVAAILGLNIIDDDGNKASQRPAPAKPNTTDNKPWLNMDTPEYAKALDFMREMVDKLDGVKELRKTYRINTHVETLLKSAK